MSLIQKLLRYRLRKIKFGREPTTIILNWKHMRELEKWLERCGLKRDCLKTIIGYQVLGMKIINKGA